MRHWSICTFEKFFLWVVDERPWGPEKHLGTYYQLKLGVLRSVIGRNWRKGSVHGAETSLACIFLRAAGSKEVGASSSKKRIFSSGNNAKSHTHSQDWSWYWHKALK